MNRLRNIISFIFGNVFNLVFLLAVVAAVFTFTNRAYEYGRVMLAVSEGSVISKEVIVEIPEEAKGKGMAVAEILEENGLIDNKYVFYLQSKLNGTDKYFKSGTFTLNTNMGTVDLQEKLMETQYVAADELRVTIVEGLTNKEIAAYLEAEEIFTAEEFLAACEEEYDYSFLEGVTRENRLEGYLFPDTYNLPENPEPRDLIVRMLNRFGEIYGAAYLDRTDEMGKSIDEIVIAASIIEKEIKSADERALCASVIYNRLEKNMNLEMCSTILYALDKRKDRLLDSDLQTDSPYNTYIYSGLPVGPICNMGEAAIKAALYPEDTDYLYFVVKDEEAGTHFFTSSYDEFVAAKAQYNQKY